MFLSLLPLNRFPLMRPCCIACPNFERSRVGALSIFHVAVTVSVGKLI